MSRKDFKALAEAITGINCISERKRVASLVGKVCANYNDNFDWYRWRCACRVTAAALALFQLERG